MIAVSTTFVGRERELEELARLLRRYRVVSLVGPGGIGKSRLALQYAAQADEAYDAAWTVRVSRAGTEDAVVAAVAATMRLRESAGDALLPVVLGAVGDANALLVLDETEEAPGVAPFVRSLLAACGSVRVLLTSRAPLTVAGERVLQVGPLADAAALFVERASSLRPNLQFSARTLPLVRTVCGRLGGIPLAIELAAAHLASAMDDASAAAVESLDRELAAFEPPTAPAVRDAEHFRALGAMLQWSYRSLDERQRRFFARLSVFAGSFSLQAAEAVAGDAAGGRDGGAAASLDALVSKALVKCTTGLQEPRFALHPVVRDYASERLRAFDEGAATLKRFCEHFGKLADRLHRDPNLVHVIDTATLEWDNLRAMLRATLDAAGDPKAGARAVIDLNPYWTESGRLADGRYWILSALELNPTEPLHAQLLYCAAVNAHARGDFAELETVCRQLVEIYGDGREPGPLARSLNGLANARYRLGDDVEAEALYRRALPAYRLAGDRFGEATALMNLGALAADRRLDYEAARELFLESLEIFTAFGVSSNVGTLLANLAEVTSRVGDHARALEYAERSRAVFERLGNSGLAAWQLCNAAIFHAEAGNLHAALDALRHARSAVSEQLCSTEHTAHFFDGVFVVAADAGDLESAALAYGHAEQYRALHGIARSPSSESVVAPRYRRLQEALGAGALASALARGKATHYESIAGLLETLEAAVG